MANENRVRGNLVNGTLSVALSNVDTTMSSAALANLPAVTASQHAVIVCENEIIYCTAHTAAATTATILRAQEGTSAAAHSINTAWVHGPVVSDFDSVLGYAQVTANQGSITTTVDLTSLSVTVTVPYAQHRVRITGYCASASNTSATGGLIMNIQEGATVLSTGAGMSTVANFGVALTVQAIIVPTAASHTYKLTGAAGNTGTATLGASTTGPAFILVEDLGPAL